MRRKWLELGILGGLIALGCVYYWSASQLPEVSGIGPDYAPKMLAVCLIILCCIKSIQLIFSKKHKSTEEERFSIGHLNIVLLVLLCLVVYFVLWSVLDLFYPATFLAICSIMLICAPKEKRWTPKFIGIMLGCAVIFLLMIYLLFSVGMDIRF